MTRALALALVLLSASPREPRVSRSNERQRLVAHLPVDPTLLLSLVPSPGLHVGQGERNSQSSALVPKGWGKVDFDFISDTGDLSNTPALVDTQSNTAGVGMSVVLYSNAYAVAVSGASGIIYGAQFTYTVTHHFTFEWGYQNCYFYVDGAANGSNIGGCPSPTTHNVLHIGNDYTGSASGFALGTISNVQFRGTTCDPGLFNMTANTGDFASWIDIASTSGTLATNLQPGPQGWADASDLQYNTAVNGPTDYTVRYWDTTAPADGAYTFSVAVKLPTLTPALSKVAVYLRTPDGTKLSGRSCTLASGWARCQTTTTFANGDTMRAQLGWAQVTPTPGTQGTGHVLAAHPVLEAGSAACSTTP